MSGMVFFLTQRLAELKTFYLDRIGCELWLDQGNCMIFKHGNFLFGYCEGEPVDDQGLVTFFFPRKDDVDAMYERLRDIAIGPPAHNERYRIYHFFARGPERRKLEFQYFEDVVTGCRTVEESLCDRRSIRAFTDEVIAREILENLFEMCRFAPTSRNCQSYYFKLVSDPAVLAWLAGTRGAASAPLGAAHLAVAVCCDTAVTKRPRQDADIAAYHFMLAAHGLGLGTCWIAAMDRDDVKERLDIPMEHYIATITPVGYPAECPDPPARKDREHFLRS
ncbi:nitroreductase family protein [bacterium]|nr:nitroreductase family protein [candidate division CSSED10-310 bacterium]